MKKDQKNRLIFFFGAALFIALVAFGVIRWAKGYRPTINGLTRGTGLLAANSFPKGAEVYIDGRLTTATDDTLNLEPGEYYIEIKNDGYHTWSKTLTIKEELVTQTNATLFPTVPSLAPLTFIGAINPVPSPDGNTIVFAVASASADTKNGLYLQALSSNPLSLNRSPRQIAKSSTQYNFQNASFTWSPDSSEIIASFPSGSNLLLDASKSNDPEDLLDVTVRLPSIFSEWEQEIARTQRAELIELPEFIMEIATRSAINLYVSPDTKKILYQATKELTIPDELIPLVLAINTQPEFRTLKPGNFYIYDLTEDRNYLIQESTLDDSSESLRVLRKTLILENILTPIPPVELGSTISAIKSITLGKSITDALEALMAQYSAIHVSNLQWFPDSLHIIITTDQGIEVMEYDTTNRVTLYSGPFDRSFVYPWPDGSRLITLIQFSPDIPANLYSIKLK